jgi:hypothetical protein
MKREVAQLLSACQGKHLTAVTSSWFLEAGQTGQGDMGAVWLTFTGGPTVHLRGHNDGKHLVVDSNPPGSSVDMEQFGRVDVNQQAPAPLSNLVGKHLDKVQGLVHQGDPDLVGLKLTDGDENVMVYIWEDDLVIGTARPLDASPGDLQEVDLD